MLQLDETERAHLHSLAQPGLRFAAPTKRRIDGVRPELQRLLTMMDRIPALIINDRFDLLAANALATALFAGIRTDPAGRRNLASYLFLDPGARDFYVEWADVAAATAGQLRLAIGHHAGDSGLAALIAHLSAGSEEFRTLWAAGDVEQRSSGAKSLCHPVVGVLTLDYENFESLSDPRQRLITLSPQARSTTEAALHVLADRDRSGRW